MADTDDKYIVFKSEDFFNQTTGLPVALWTSIAIPDAVVIRRQDKFASPALATYAACIAITAAEIEDPVKRANLLRVADYFEDQAKLAADEGYKLPDV
jgi:hypothetical protein